MFSTCPLVVVVLYCTILLFYMANYQLVTHDTCIHASLDTGESDSSVNLLSRPEHMLVKCTSFSSVESDQSEGNRAALLSRAGTMTEGALIRKDKGKTETRPKSEMIIKGAQKDLEASFEVSGILWMLQLFMCDGGHV